jgi:D-aminopeptidase
MKILLDQRLDPLYEAVIEATEEAILNALCMADDMAGANGNFVPALPLDDVKELIGRWQAAARRPPDARGAGPAARPPPEGAATRTGVTTPAAKPSAVRGAEGMAPPAPPAKPEGGGGTPPGA